jgi:hypothetical protein
MSYLTAFALIIIIVLTSIIVYNLYVENRFIKEMTKQEMRTVEGFQNNENVQPPNNAANLLISSEKTTFPLREFIIQSSYNSAIKDGEASKEQLTELINAGVRVFDFEIYERNGDTYVSYAEDKEYRRLETDLSLTVDTAFSHMASKAFSQPKSGPLFVHLRVKTPSAKTFQQLSTSIQQTFGSRLLPRNTEINGSTLFEDVIDKVIIIHDLTSGNRPKKFSCSNTDNCVQYEELVNIFSGSMDLPLYTQMDYTTNMGLTNKVSIEPATGRTDINTFFMVAPSSFERVCKTCNVMETMETKPCQMLLMPYNEKTDELNAYLSIFKRTNTSYCPVSQYLEMLREQNVET